MSLLVRVFLCCGLFLALTAEAFVSPSPNIHNSNSNYDRFQKTTGVVLFAKGRFRARLKRVFRRNKSTDVVNHGDSGGVSSPATKAATATALAVATLETPQAKPALPSRVDALLGENNPQEALELMQSTRYLNEDMYWRYVRAHYELYLESKDDTYLQKGIDLANQGLEDDKFPTARDILLRWKATMVAASTTK